MITVAMLYYLYCRIEIQEIKCTKKCIDKGIVGDKYGKTNFFVVFKRSDGNIHTQEGISDLVYYSYEVGKVYVDYKQKIIFK